MAHPAGESRRRPGVDPGSGKAEGDQHRSFPPFSDVTEVEVDVPRGRLELGSRARGDVRLRTAVATRRRRLWFRRERGERPILHVVQTGRRLEIRAPRRRITRVQIDLPPGVSVRARVGTGELTLWGAAGDLELEVVRGTLAGRELAGRTVRARNHDGEVNLHFAAVPDDVEANADRGPVLLVLPPGSYRIDADERAEVTVHAHADARPRVRAHSPGGSVSILASAGSQPI